MRRAPLIAVVLLLAAAGAGVWALLASGGDAAGDGALSRRAATSPETPALPSFKAGELPERVEEPQPIALAPPELAPGGGAREAGASAARDDVPRRRIAGRAVRLSDGSPLAGLRVQAPTGPPAEAGDPPLAETLTRESDGGFVLSGVWTEADALSLAFSGGGRWPPRRRSQEIEPGASDLTDLRLVFDSGFAVHGSVLDESAHPLGEAVVDADNGRVEVRADAAGRFTLRDVAPEPGVPSVRISARAPGHVRAGTDVLVPRDVSQAPRIELVLPASGAIAGRVTDRRGAPLASVRVALSWSMTAEHGSAAPDGLSAVTGADGVYLVDHVPPGRYVVDAGPHWEGQPTHQAYGRLDEHGSHGPAGEAGPAPEPGGRLDPAPEPPPSPAPPPPSGVVPSRVADVDVAPGRTTALDFVLPAPAFIAGRVRDESGAPVAGAELKLERIERWPAPDVQGHTVSTSAGVVMSSRQTEDGTGETELAEQEAKVTTDERGEYRFDGLSAGEKRLSVDPGAAGLVPQSRALFVQPEDRLPAVDFTLVRGVAIRGRVLDAAGAPIEGVSVQAELADTRAFAGRTQARTDDDGRFALEGLPPVEHQLLLVKPGFATIWEAVVPGGAERRWTMRPAMKVIGVVTHALHGEPITKFDVELSWSGSTMGHSGSTYPEGRFEMPIDEDHSCTVTIRAAGFHEFVAHDVRPSITALEPLRVALEPLP